MLTYFDYDNNGSVVRMLEGANATEYRYGPHGLTTAIKPPSEAATYFYYDGRLNRYKQNQAGTISYFVWEGMNLLEERDAAGAIKARYTHCYTPIPGIGSVVEVQRVTATTTYYQYLHMGDGGKVAAVTDWNQNTMISYVQDAFGRALAADGGILPNAPNDLVYQSNWRTFTIGGKRYGFSPTRITLPELGRFLARDMRPRPGKNQYEYVVSNPLTLVDPEGTQDTDIKNGFDFWEFLSSQLDPTVPIVRYSVGPSPAIGIVVHGTRLSEAIARSRPPSETNRLEAEELNREALIIKHMPALRAIHNCPCEAMKYIYAFFYSFENVITLGAFENQDRTQAMLDLGMINLQEAQSQARLNVGRGAIGIMLALAPFRSRFGVEGRRSFLMKNPLLKQLLRPVYDNRAWKTIQAERARLYFMEDPTWECPASDGTGQPRFGVSKWPEPGHRGAMRRFL